MRRLAFLFGFLAILLMPATAWAHPLGNFTVNRYSRIEVDGSRLRIRYVVDMAEIPTFQELPSVDDGYAARTAAQLVRGAHVSVDGKQAQLSVSQPELSLQDGQGGLKTLRLSA